MAKHNQQTDDNNLDTDELGEKLLLKALAAFDISRENAQLIISKFTKLTLRKGESFCKKDVVSKQLGILINGFLISKYETLKTPEVVSRFFYRSKEPNMNDNFIVSSFKSFTEQSKSEETIEALEESYLRCISYDDLQELYKTVPQMNYVSRVLAEFSYIKAMQRVHLLQIKNHVDRVQEYYSQQPVILAKAQVQHLASYLATDRKNISRARKKLKTK